MKKWLLGVLIGFVAVAFTLDAEAARLSGGKSFGRPSPTVQQRQATPPQAAPQTPQAQSPARQPGAATPATPAKPASPWRGALMGLAAGLGLAALAHWLGFGDTMATIMMIALIGLVGMAVIGYFLRRRSAQMQPAYPSGRPDAQAGYPAQPPEAAPQPMQRSMDAASGQPGALARPGSAMDEFTRGTASLDQPWGIPAGFDTEGFLANAKTYFGKLQAAWDANSLADLEEFATPDMFIALTHELRERGSTAKSEVAALDAKLLGIESSATDHLASVRFTGTLRSGAEIEPFDEVWNLVKPLDGKTGWLLSGIQQMA